MGALTITNIILGVPYYNYSIMGPKTVFQLLRPLCRILCWHSSVECSTHRTRWPQSPVAALIDHSDPLKSPQPIPVNVKKYMDEYDFAYCTSQIFQDIATGKNAGDGGLINPFVSSLLAKSLTPTPHPAKSHTGSFSISTGQIPIGEPEEEDLSSIAVCPQWIVLFTNSFVLTNYKYPETPISLN